MLFGFQTVPEKERSQNLIRYKLGTSGYVVVMRVEIGKKIIKMY